MINRVILRATNGNHKGEEFILEKEADYILGRSKGCSLVLNDPLCLVSRRHCRIEVHASAVHICDLGSRNGTKVNGKLIGQPQKSRAFENDLHKPEDGCPLEDGDTLQIAGYDFQVQFDLLPPCAIAQPRDQNKLWSCDCTMC